MKYETKQEWKACFKAIAWTGGLLIYLHLVCLLPFAFLRLCALVIPTTVAGMAFIGYILSLKESV